MGSCCAKPEENPRRIVMVGLDNSGKTTILQKLKGGDDIDIDNSIPPTVGFNVETLEYKRSKFSVWDIGGQDRIRSLWKHYYKNADAVIFVIDSDDKKRIVGGKKSAKAEFHKMIGNEQLQGCPVLIFANKQDLDDVVSPEEVTEMLGLSDIEDRKWKVVGSVAQKGTGLDTGLEWIQKLVAEEN